MTPDQLRILTQMITDRYGYIAAQMQSVEYVPDPQQLERWKQLGLVGQDVTPATFASSIPVEMHLLRNAFVMGRLAEAVEQGQTFEQIMQAAMMMPLKKPDFAAIAVAEQQTANYIRNFAGDVATEAGKLWAQKQAETVRNMAIEYHGQTLQAKVLDADKKIEAGEIVPRKQVTSWQQFASELHHTMDDKVRDWQRVAYTELTDAQKQGEAHRQLSQSGPDELVYKMPMPTACAQCKHLYLLPDGKTPRLFRLKDMLNNGTNIGCKAHPTKGGKVVAGGRPDGMETLKAVVGVVHPFCQCAGIYRFTSYEPWATQKQKEIYKQYVENKKNK